MEKNIFSFIGISSELVGREPFLKQISNKHDGIL